MRQDPSGWRTRLDEETIARRTADGSWSGRTIADRLDALAELSPGLVLLSDNLRSLTVSEIRSEARHLAGVMAARGLRPGEVVSFQLPNWHEAVLVDLACAYGGFVCNPIVPIYRDAEVAFIVADARSRMLFVPERFRGFDHAAMAERLRPQWPDLLEVVVVRPQAVSESAFAVLMERASTTLPAPPDPNHVKLLMYTSGTTTRAKGVLHTHNTIDAEVRNFMDWLGLDPSDVILMPSPVAHITGYLYGIELPVTLGRPVHLMERWDPAEAADLIDGHGITFTVGATPFLQELARFAAESGRRLPSLRYFPTGGAPVPPEVIHSANRAFERCRSFRIYGSTEAPTVTLGVPDPGQPDLGATTEGFVVGNEVRLVDDRGREVPAGQEGEIVTRGPEVCLGYAAAEQNADAFDAEGFFRTGDLAVQTPEGCLIITGRRKDLIIRGGENLSPKEIEDVLYGHAAVRDAAVVAMPHPRLGETCCAFVTLQSGATFGFADMVAVLEASGLARQKFPERLEIVDQLPLTAAGKIRKNVLRDQIAAKVKAESSAHAGAGPEKVARAAEPGDA